MTAADAHDLFVIEAQRGHSSFVILGGAFHDAGCRKPSPRSVESAGPARSLCMSSTHPPTLPAPADERDADAARVPDSVEVDAALVDNVLATLRGLEWPSLITAVVF